MHVRSIMTAMAATTLTLTVGTTLASSPAHAAGGSRTLSGPATGDSDVYLTYVGCADLLAERDRARLTHQPRSLRRPARPPVAGPRPDRRT